MLCTSHVSCVDLPSSEAEMTTQPSENSDQAGASRSTGWNTTHGLQVDPVTWKDAGRGSRRVRSRLKRRNNIGDNPVIIHGQLTNPTSLRFTGQPLRIGESIAFVLQ